MEKAVEVLERQCHENMKHAIATEEGLGIEYDEDVICDVCRSPDSEDGNDMVFCDKCNICVHQVSGSGGHRLPMGSLAGAQSSPPAPISGWQLAFKGENKNLASPFFSNSFRNNTYYDPKVT